MVTALLGDDLLTTFSRACARNKGRNVYSSLLGSRQRNSNMFSMQSVRRPLLGNRLVNTPLQQYGEETVFYVVRAKAI
jgi:hypothetical protein